MAVPPELMAMLQAGGGGMPPGMDPGMMGPPQGGPPVGPEAPPDTSTFLAELIDHARQYDEIERDPQDLAVMAKVIAQLRQLMAAQQKEADAAMGVGPAAKFLRRQGP